MPVEMDDQPVPQEQSEDTSTAGRPRSLLTPEPAGLFGALFVACAAVTAATLGDYGLASDVVNYFRNSLDQLEWAGGFLDALASGQPGEWLERERVLQYWRWWPERIPHPPLSRELGAVSYLALADVIDPITAYRGAVGTTYSVLVAGVGAFVHRCRGSLVAGLGAGLCVMAIPAVFAYGHLALTDLFLAAFWFLSVAGLELHLRTERRLWLAAAAVFFGAAVATKFTGLLVGPVLGVWLLIRKELSWGRAAALVAGGVGLFVLVNPVMWIDPALGLADYFGAGFQRRSQEATGIVTHYLGQDYLYRPPWHYPFVWTAVAVPVPVWLVVGAGGFGARSIRVAHLCALNLAVLYGALMLPDAPLHDGVRLFLPAFPFFAVLAGLGLEQTREWAATALPERLRARSELAAALVLVGTVGVGVLQTARYHPYQLSYFNVLIGGVDGADRAGLEVAPMKEALTPAVLDGLAERIPPDATVDPDFFIEEMCFYRQRGRIPAGWTLEAEMEGETGDGPVTLVCRPETRQGVFGVRREPATEDFLILPNRRGSHTREEHALWRFGSEPFFELSLQGVPLLRVYRMAES